MKYYSPSTKGFYDKDVHNVIPEDSVEITDEYWQELLGNEIEFDGEKPIIKVYTEQELAQQELNTKLSEAQQYLNDTDHKMYSDYERKEDETQEVMDYIKEQRSIARAFIRANK